MNLYSYVVRYDSGFAPNPFYGFCTLATCKPTIRKGAAIGDWVVGCGSNDRTVRRGGHLVYAMRVTEIIDFRTFSTDSRFQMKVPYRTGSRKQSCGDNIYFRDPADTCWNQRDSLHSRSDGTPNAEHVAKDTKVDRVLVSDDFVYFGGEGPAFPQRLRDFDGQDVCKAGIGMAKFTDAPLNGEVVAWIRSLRVVGYAGPPFEWICLRGRRE